MTISYSFMNNVSIGVRSVPILLSFHFLHLKKEQNCRVKEWISRYFGFSKRSFHQLKNNCFGPIWIWQQFSLIEKSNRRKPAHSLSLWAISVAEVPSGKITFWRKLIQNKTKTKEWKWRGNELYKTGHLLAGLKNRWVKKQWILILC